MSNSLKTINPFTEEDLKTYPHMSDAEAMAVVEASHTAFLDWRLKSLEERAEVIAAIGAEMRKSKEDFAQLMTDEVGKLLKDSRSEVDLCAAICDYTAKIGPDALADEEREIEGGKGYVTHSPIGVVYGIQPWNFPAYQAVRYSIASLMAGNGVLLKHAEACTGSGLFLRDLYERAGLPKGLFGVLLISHDQSDKIIEDERIRGVTLTGSDRAGRAVGAKAAELVKKTVLELGSNDAYLVLDDADLDLAVKTCVQGRIYNNGQTCVNAKRFIVTEKNYDAFVEAYAEAFRSIKLGDPKADDTQLGPMVTKKQRDELHQQVKESIEKARDWSSAETSRSAKAGSIRPRCSPMSHPASPPMRTNCSGPLPQSSVRRMIWTPCGSPTAAATVSAGASSAAMSSGRASWQPIISIPAWCSSTPSMWPIRACRSVA